MATKNKPLIFTKSDLIQTLSEQNKITKVMASLIVNSVLDSITKALKQGNRVEVRHFGTFEIRTYGSYQGRNPQTGEKILVKSKKLPFFKPGKFREKINDSKP